MPWHLIDYTTFRTVHCFVFIYLIVYYLIFFGRIFTDFPLSTYQFSDTFMCTITIIYTYVYVLSQQFVYMYAFSFTHHMTTNFECSIYRLAMSAQGCSISMCTFLHLLRCVFHFATDQLWENEWEHEHEHEHRHDRTPHIHYTVAAAVGRLTKYIIITICTVYFNRQYLQLMFACINLF